MLRYTTNQRRNALRTGQLEYDLSRDTYNLIGWYPLHDLRDKTPNANHLTVTGTPERWVKNIAKIGSTRTCWVNAATVEYFDTGIDLFDQSTFSISGYMRRFTSTSLAYISQTLSSSGTELLQIGMFSDNNTYIGVTSNNAQFTYNDGATTEWVHWVLTYKAASSSIGLFIDGVEQDTSSYTASTPTGSSTGGLTIGYRARSTLASTAYFKDIRVSLDCWTPEQAREIYYEPWRIAKPTGIRKMFYQSRSSAGTFTGTAAATTSAATASGSATFTAPVYSGSASPSVGNVSASASGTFTPPVYSGSAAPTAQAATASGSGTFASAVYSGTASATIGNVSASASGTFTAPTYSGSATPTVSASIAAATGTFTAPGVFTGSSAATINAVVAAGTGTFVAPEIFTGSATPTLSNVLASASATFEPPVYTGTIAAVIANVTAQGFSRSGELTPMHALAQAIRDSLRTQESLRNEYCETRLNGQPNPNSGQYFVSVFPMSFRPGRSNVEQHVGEDFTVSIGIGITQRTGYVPEDRMFRDGAFLREKGRGCLWLLEHVNQTIRKERWNINQAAELLLDVTDWPGKFVEPVYLRSNNAKVVTKGPAWFYAKEPKTEAEKVRCKDYGVYVELHYAGGRYMEAYQP